MHRNLSAPVGLHLAARLQRLCLDRTVADIGLGQQRRCGNRRRYRARLCCCLESGRWLRHGGGERRRSGFLGADIGRGILVRRLRERYAIIREARYRKAARDRGFEARALGIRPARGRHSRAWRVSANQPDHPRECDGTCDAGCQQGFHCPHSAARIPTKATRMFPIVQGEFPRKKLCATKHISASPVAGDGSSHLPQLDLVADLVGEADAADGQHHVRRQLLVSLQAAGRQARRGPLSRSRAARRCRPSSEIGADWR